MQVPSSSSSWEHSTRLACPRQYAVHSKWLPSGRRLHLAAERAASDQPPAHQRMALRLASAPRPLERCGCSCMEIDSSCIDDLLDPPRMCVLLRWTWSSISAVSASDGTPTAAAAIADAAAREAFGSGAQIHWSPACRCGAAVRQTRRSNVRMDMHSFAADTRHRQADGRRPCWTAEQLAG